MGSDVAQHDHDVWLPTVCYGCYNACGILVHRVDGVVVDLAGDPANPSSRGHLCAKGKARVIDLYDPSRLLRPLRRRNPDKGIGVDPLWEEISWPEALSIVADRLREARATDPRGVVLAHFDLAASPIIQCWARAFGTPHASWSSAALYCGMGSHAVNMLVNGSFNSEIDFEHCAHAVLVGTQMGFMVDSNAQVTTRAMAEARARGMKLTVIDPVCGPAASKADAWIPIQPGTDSALALGILHQLLNVLGVYDAEFLRARTNAPYLIGGDGRYVRDPNDGRPLVWDATAGMAVTFDRCPPDRAALEGTFEVMGDEAIPAFQLLERHVARYSPELVESITDVPAARVVSLAAELAADSRIGETITIDGHELPIRPVALNFKMGAVGHRHGFATAFALHLINIVLGAIDVPGGFLGVNPVGPTWAPEEGPDGMLMPAARMRFVGYNSPFPGRDVGAPETLSLHEVFPVAHAGRVLYPFTILDRESFGIDVSPEVLIQCRANVMMSSMQPDRIGEVLREVPFMVSFATHLDETAEFADIVLPDAHDFERDDPYPANHPFAFHAAAQGVWYGARRRPVVDPIGEARPWADVMLELAYEVGFGEELHQTFNSTFGLDGGLALRRDERVTVGDIADRQMAKEAASAGAEMPGTLQGTVVGRQKRVDEAYPGRFVRARLPIYLEHLLGKVNEVRAALGERGLDWDLADYQALPDWRPTAAQDSGGGRFDLIAVPLKLPFLSNSNSVQNRWLADLAERHPYAFRLLMHKKTAAWRGICDGDDVVVSSSAGSVSGRVRLTEGIHPDVVAIAGVAGHWAKGMPIAAGRGLHFNRLIPLDLERVDKLSSGFDSKVRVTVEPAPPQMPRTRVERIVRMIGGRRRR